MIEGEYWKSEDESSLLSNADIPQKGSFIEIQMTKSILNLVLLSGHNYKILLGNEPLFNTVNCEKMPATFKNEICEIVVIIDTLSVMFGRAVKLLT